MKVVISCEGVYDVPEAVVMQYAALTGKDIRVVKRRLVLIDYELDGEYWHPDYISRKDSYLVQAVEELQPSNLKVVEIPDDIDYYIDECETGEEVIHESHRTWN